MTFEKVRGKLSIPARPCLGRSRLIAPSRRCTQFVAVCCSVLQSVTVRCSVLRVLQVLQYASCCSVLQCVTVLQCVECEC